jgi:hypothetical protein
MAPFTACKSAWALVVAAKRRSVSTSPSLMVLRTFETPGKPSNTPSSGVATIASISVAVVPGRCTVTLISG